MMSEVTPAIKAQNPDLEAAWRTIAWWEQTCDYWRERAYEGYALRDSLTGGQAAPPCDDSPHGAVDCGQPANHWSPAAPTEDAVAFIRALVDAWGCCGTCAGGVLAKRDQERDAARVAAVEADRDDLARLNDDKVERIAGLRARLIAAEERLARVKVLVDKWERWAERERATGDLVNMAAAYVVEDLRAALHPDPAQGDD